MSFNGYDGNVDNFYLLNIIDIANVIADISCISFPFVFWICIYRKKKN